MHLGWLSLLLLAGVLLCSRPMLAAETPSEGSLKDRLSVSVAEDVISCSAQLDEQKQAIATALKDGIASTTVWHLQVARVREYWFNAAVADIKLKRRVEPDLLARNWLLMDEASGISQRVYQLDDAVRFLSVLEQFSVLDRTLLQATTPYRMTVKVEVYHGEMASAWWRDIWHPSQAAMQQDFTLQ